MIFLFTEGHYIELFNISNDNKTIRSSWKAIELEFEGFIERNPEAFTNPFHVSWSTRLTFKGLWTLFLYKRNKK